MADRQAARPKKNHSNMNQNKTMKGQKIKATATATVNAELPAHPLVIFAVDLLRERNQTVSFAESCTGGLLSDIFTRLPGVSDVFAGSVVAYSYEVKQSLLQVPEPMLKSLGAVSLPVAKQMARGVRKNLQTSWAVSVTGIAGPNGGSAQKPVGTVCFGIVGPGVEEVVQRQFDGDRRQVQGASARFALRLLISYLVGKTAEQK